MKYVYTYDDYINYLCMSLFKIFNITFEVISKLLFDYHIYT